MVGKSRFLWIAALLLLAGCATNDDRFGNLSDGYVADAGSVVSGVDWSKAEKLSVTLSEFAFEPAAFTFRVGQPYALQFSNDGAIGHTFVAPEFFRSIAAKSLLYSDGETSFPVLEAIYLNADESKTLFFVPVEKGDFKFNCDRPLHSSFGMKGQVRIE